MYQQTFKASIAILKRLWRDYIRKYKKTYLIVIILMILAQGLLLATPLITSTILDDHLSSITAETWYRVETNDRKTVTYKGHYYKQARYLSDAEKNYPLTILLIDDVYYAIEAELEFGEEAQFKVEGNQLIVTEKEQTIVYDGLMKLTKDDIRAFYLPTKQALAHLLTLLVAISGLSILVGRYQRFLMRSMNVKIVRDARKDAVRKLQHLPMEYYEVEPAGKMANRILYDVNGLSLLIDSIFHIALHAILALVTAYIGMFVVNWKIALATIILLPILLLWARYFMFRMRESAREVNENYSRVAEGLNRLINAIPLLQIFNYRKPAVDKFNRTSYEYMEEYLHEVKLHMSLGGNLLELFSAIVVAALVLFFGWGGFHFGHFAVTAGTINAFIAYLPRVIEPFYYFLEEVEHLEHGFARSERFFKLIDTEGEDSSFEVVPPFKGAIEFKDVWFKYKGGDDYVLKGLNLKIEPGETVAIVGESQSGKSTIVNLLLRFYDLDENDRGQILVDGQDITTFSKRTYRNHIGIVLQEPLLFDGTIASNIRFGRDDVTDEEILEVLRELGAESFIEKLEGGIYHEVYQDGQNLSHGEIQLIAIARSIVHQSAILIMDEPTEYLDSETEEMVHHAIKVVSEGRTAIIIEHNLLAVRDVDRILFLHDGRIVEEGTHEELLKLNGLYAEMYRTQISLL